MDIGYVWDEGKYGDVRRKHGVTFAEVVSAFEDKHNYEETDPAGHADRCLLIGETTGGRLLQVVFTLDYTEAGAPLYRIITAFDAERRWLDEYHERRGF